MRKDPGSHLGLRICLKGNGAPSGVSPQGAPSQSEALLPSGLQGGCKLSSEEHALRRKDLGSSLTVGREGDPEISASVLRGRGGEGVVCSKGQQPAKSEVGGLVLVRAAGVRN